MLRSHKILTHVSEKLPSSSWGDIWPCIRVYVHEIVFGVEKKRIVEVTSTDIFFILYPNVRESAWKYIAGIQ